MQPQQPPPAYPQTAQPPVVYPPQAGQQVVYPPGSQVPQVVYSQGVPVNQVVYPQPAVQGGYVVQNTAPRSGGCNGTNFKIKAGMVTGIIQIVCAVLSIILSGASYVYGNYFYYAGMGIWSAILFFLPAGILGVCSKWKNTCVIVAYLVMCILSALEASGMVIYEGIIAGFSTYVYSCRSYSDYYYGSSTSCGYYYVTVPGVIALHSILAIIAFVEFIVAIVGAAFCCGGLCCGKPTTVTTTTTNTVYYNTATPHVQPTPGQMEAHVVQQGAEPTPMKA